MEKIVKQIIKITFLKKIKIKLPNGVLPNNYDSF